MKFKAAVTSTAPKSLVDGLAGRDFNLRLIKEVLGGALQVEHAAANPAAYFAQMPDETVELEDGLWGVELTLSKTSVRDGRNFGRALSIMEEALTDIIRRTVPSGRRVQIHCVIQTDVPVVGTNSTLFEMKEPRWVYGAAAA